ncbi:MAG: pyridoxine 5'-phosphate synthase, partial [Bacteroidales bacterium]|nr:pyridoxine 5'-phosphate synthase [Bacteroidales bacterium]
TSNDGWDNNKNESFLTEVVAEFKRTAIRTYLFVEADARMIENAKKTGTDRVELYTEQYATDFAKSPEDAVRPFVEAARAAAANSLGLNAGHDLNLDNLRYFAHSVPGLLEVSIGHALIADSLYLGLENTIQLYLRQLR